MSWASLTPENTAPTQQVFVHNVFAPVGRPDASILSDSGPTRGSGVFNVTGLRQTEKVTAARGSVTTFTLRFANASWDTDAIGVLGVPGADWLHVHYFIGSKDVTASVEAGTRSTRELLHAASKTLTMKIRIGAAALKGSKAAVLVTASSKNQPAVKDVVRATFTVGT
jgi:hypothetical protein